MVDWTARRREASSRTSHANRDQVELGVRSDYEVLLAWRDGDSDAADELIHRYFDPICRFFRSKLGDDVDDLIQRTFLDCVKAHERFRGEGSFRSYLFSIAHHRLFDHLRATRRAPDFDSLTSLSVRDLGTTPSGAIVRSEEYSLLKDALDELPLEHRVVLELSYWEEMSAPEIAVVVGIPPNTVRSRLSRARAALRSKLESLEADPIQRGAQLEALGRVTGRLIAD